MNYEVGYVHFIYMPIGLGYMSLTQLLIFILISRITMYSQFDRTISQVQRQSRKEKTDAIITIITV